MLPLYIKVGLLHLMVSSMSLLVARMISRTRWISAFMGWFFFLRYASTRGFFGIVLIYWVRQSGIMSMALVGVSFLQYPFYPLVRDQPDERHEDVYGACNPGTEKTGNDRG